MDAKAPSKPSHGRKGLATNWRNGKVGLVRHAHNKSLLQYTSHAQLPQLLDVLPTLSVTRTFFLTYFPIQILHGAFSLIVASIHPWLPHSHGLFP